MLVPVSPSGTGYTLSRLMPAWWARTASRNVRDHVAQRLGAERVRAWARREPGPSATAPPIGRRPVAPATLSVACARSFVDVRGLQEHVNGIGL